MLTFNQIIKKKKRFKKKITKTTKKKPQIKGICLNIFTLNPKKPNSAERKCAQVRLSTGKIITIYIPGEGNHSLQKFSTVLIRGGRIKDLPGIKYKAVNNKFDLNDKTTSFRKKSRSKYGVNKPEETKLKHLKKIKKANDIKRKNETYF